MATDEELFEVILSELCQEMMKYLPEALTTHHPREDNVELVHLVHSSVEPFLRVMFPRATQPAQWIPRWIYVLRNLHLPPPIHVDTERRDGHHHNRFFLGPRPGYFLVEAPVDQIAAPNELQFFESLKIYWNYAIRDKAWVASSRHYRYLYEDLAGLFLFDNRFGTNIKVACVTKSENHHSRIVNNVPL